MPGGSIRYLTFVETGMASMTTLFQDGSEVEVGLFGHESVIGMPALMEAPQSSNRIYMQIAGHGYRCSIEKAAKEFDRGGLFRALTLGCVQTQLLHSTQSTGCNAKHSIEQRLARWLLLCADRTNSASFLMPQAFLADMLGTRRTTVTAAAGALKQAGMIRYARGKMEILDAAMLQTRSCECYRVIRDYAHSTQRRSPTQSVNAFM